MRLMLSSLILTIVVVVTFGKAQYPHPNSPYVFRGYPIMARQQDSRFFFGSFTTFTYTITTTTVTATATTTTTCTTSATTLSTCTAGRRRREAKDGNLRNPRGLFYDEKKEDIEESSIFLPAPVPTAEESEAARASRQLETQPAVPAIPFTIQPTFGAFFAPEVGYEIPAALPLSRLFLAFGTATVTVTTTATATSKLTATCSSTTGFSVCSS